MTQAIEMELELPSAPEAVWNALTDPELIGKWLMPTNFKASVGHHFRFQARPLPGWDGVVRCEVLACKPYETLSYSWQGGSEQIGHLDTVVTWTLTPTATGTHLRLVHSGFGPANQFALQNMGQGWRGKIADALRQVVANQTISAP